MSSTLLFVYVNILTLCCLLFLGKVNFERCLKNQIAKILHIFHVRNMLKSFSRSGSLSKTAKKSSKHQKWKLPIIINSAWLNRSSTAKQPAGQRYLWQVSNSLIRVFVNKAHTIIIIMYNSSSQCCVCDYGFLNSQVKVMIR